MHSTSSPTVRQARASRSRECRQGGLRPPGLTALKQHVYELSPECVYWGVLPDGERGVRGFHDLRWIKRWSLSTSDTPAVSRRLSHAAFIAGAHDGSIGQGDEKNSFTEQWRGQSGGASRDDPRYEALAVAVPLMLVDTAILIDVARDPEVRIRTRRRELH